MEQCADLRLRFLTKIDQQVATRHHVEAGKRRVGQHVLHGKHHRLAQLGQDTVAVVLAYEKARQPVGRDVVGDRRRVKAETCGCDRRRVDVGGEYLQTDDAFLGGDRLLEQHGERIRFLARAAAGHPQPDRLIGGLLADQLGDDRLRQLLEHRRVPKKARDVDQQVLGQRRAFGLVSPQAVEVAVAVGCLDAGHRHPPLDAPLQRAGLV